MNMYGIIAGAVLKEGDILVLDNISALEFISKDLAGWFEHCGY